MSAVMVPSSLIPLGSGFRILNENLRDQSQLHLYSSRGVPSRAFKRLSCSLFGAPPGLGRRSRGGCTLQRKCGHDLFKGRAQAEGSSAATDQGEVQEISQATLIWRAVKLPIYSVALIPLTVGSAVAFFQTGVLSTRRYFLLLISSIFIITWLNLSNDVYDFDTGADKDKKESVVNLVRSRMWIAIAAYSLLILGFLGLILASLEARNTRAMILLSCAITCGYIYQCPPFRLSYQGLGEPLCFAAFGPFATTAFYLMQSSIREISITGTVLAASFFVGLTSTVILFCSHFHQVEGDKAVGKNSPLVRLGTKTGSQVVKAAILGLYSSLLVGGVSRYIPVYCILFCALTLPMGRSVMSFVEQNHEDKDSIFLAKYYCVKLHTLFGLALSAGFVAARMLNG